MATLLHNNDVIMSVLGLLSHRDLLSFKLTCSAARDAADCYMHALPPCDEAGFCDLMLTLGTCMLFGEKISLDIPPTYSYGHSATGLGSLQSYRHSNRLRRCSRLSLAISGQGPGAADLRHARPAFLSSVGNLLLVGLGKLGPRRRFPFNIPWRWSRQPELLHQIDGLRFDHVTGLALLGTSTDPVDLPWLLARLPSLVHLALTFSQGTVTSELPPRTTLPPLPNLRLLWLHHWSWEEEGVVPLAGAIGPLFPSLSHLVLDMPTGDIKLSDLHGLSQLHTLEITHATGPVSLEGIDGLPRLERLCLFDCEVDTHGVDLDPVLSQFQLRTLVLTSEAQGCWCRATRLPRLLLSLQELILPDGHLDDSMADQLAGLPLLAVLEVATLDLQRCAGQPGGPSPPVLPSLRELCVEDSAASLAPLASLAPGLLRLSCPVHASPLWDALPISLHTVYATVAPDGDLGLLLSACATADGVAFLDISVDLPHSPPRPRAGVGVGAGEGHGPGPAAGAPPETTPSNPAAAPAATVTPLLSAAPPLFPGFHFLPAADGEVIGMGEAPLHSWGYIHSCTRDSPFSPISARPLLAFAALVGLRDLTIAVRLAPLLPQLPPIAPCLSTLRIFGPAIAEPPPGREEDVAVFCGAMATELPRLRGLVLWACAVHAGVLAALLRGHPGLNDLSLQRCNVYGSREELVEAAEVARQGAKASLALELLDCRFVL